MKTKFTSPFPRAAIMLLLMLFTAETAWAQGAGTMDNPYQISNYAQLKQFASIVNGGNIDAYAVLTADIACTDNTWTPIGCDSEHSYAGTFDGRGYTITGLSNANNASSNNAGLFGNVASEGTVKNVILVDAAINGESFTGSIAGWNGGTVQNCCLIGASNISSIDKVGGIVGYNCDLGKIQNCYVATSGSISISTSDYTYSVFRVGGIAGLNNATIQNCHFSGSGSLSGSNLGTGNNYSVGGIVGETTYGSIVRYCYYAGTGTISGNTIGAIIGSNSQTVTSCYYNTNNTSLTKAIGNQDDTDDVKGLTAAQFKNISNFSGFTPENWFQGVVAPLLKGMPYTISFNANGGTGSMANQTVTSTNSDALSTNTFTRTGYHFTGWNTKADGTGVAVAINTEARQVGSETLYAQWEATSGTCGDYGNADNVTWAVTDTNDDGSYETLTISGTGAMKNYNNNQPWAAFKSDITTVVIEEGVTRIGDFAFKSHTALTSVSIASSVTTIGNAAFFECTNLATINGASGVTDAGEYNIFDGTAWVKNLPNGLTCVGHVAYRFVGDGTSVTLDAATTQIAEACFYGSQITSIVIPASVERIGDSAFANSALQKMYVLRHESSFPEITLLGSDAFEICFNLTIVVPAAAYSTYSGHWYSYNSKLQRGYNITCNEGITATSYAPIVAEGETVTLSGTGTIPDGYAFAGYSVKDADDDDVIVTETSGVYSFTMPSNDVTVTATWTTIPWTGSGDSADDPYIIEYPSQLDLLATNVNNGESYSGKYFVLANDITYTHTTDWNLATSTENNYTPIGHSVLVDPTTNKNTFNGIFDGNGKTISGIRIYRDSNNDADNYAGLFGSIGCGGIVKNVTLSDARITGYHWVGGIAGKIESGTIENCHVTSSVVLNAVQNHVQCFGGIAGETTNVSAASDPFILACTSSVTITMSDGSFTDCKKFGGIVGNIQDAGRIEDCLAIDANIYVSDISQGGAILGYSNVTNMEYSLTNNYYCDCTLNGSTSNIGCKNNDISVNNGALEATLLSETQTSMPTTTPLEVVFRRSFTKDVASTVCLPFDIDATQAAAAGKFYTFVGVDKTNPDNWEVIMYETNKASGTLEANTPYLFVPSNTRHILFHGTAATTIEAGTVDQGSWHFKGTYENLTWDEGQTVLYGLAGNAFTPTGGGTYEIGSFQRFNSGTTAAFRAYMYYGDTAPAHHAAPILPESMKVRLIAADGSTTEVKEVREVLTPEGMSVARNKDNIWYTLDGRKLNAQPTQKGLYIVNGKKVVIK